MGPFWVFTAHKEQWDRQSAEAEGSTRRQAASTSPCHSILSWFFLLGGEKEQTMRSVITYPVGCILSPQLSHQFLLAGYKASILVRPLQMTKQRPRETQWGPRPRVKGGNKHAMSQELCVRSFPTQLSFNWHNRSESS